MTEHPDAPRCIDDLSPPPRARPEAPADRTERVEALGLLAGGIAHDFNNLLQVISGYAYVIQAHVENGSVDLARLARASEAIRAATDQAAILTEKLHEITRDPGSTRRIVGLNGVVEAVRPAFDPAIGGIVVRTKLAPDLWPVAIDPAEFETALRAVLANARDATPPGGGVTVETENVRLEERSIALLQGVAAGRYVAVTVSDTGSGMAPEVLARATEPFFSTREPGTAHGLGLTLVDRIAKRAMGALRICSTPGDGTTIRLLLPAAESAVSVGTPGDG